MAVINTVDKLKFLSFIFAVLLSITVHFIALRHEILLSDLIHKTQTHHRAKFRQNCSIGCKDIKIFRFFKIATAILDF